MMTMLTDVQDYLESRRGKWREIAVEAEVSYDWLTKFMQGQISEPGYNKIHRLYVIAQGQKNSSAA
jgi:hypothetical protein